MISLLYASAIFQQLGSLVIAIFGLIIYGQRSTFIITIGAYGLLSFILQAIQFVSLYYHLSLNNQIGNISILCECLLLNFFFYQTINQRSLKLFIASLMILYILIFIVVVYRNLGGTFSSIQAMRDVTLIVCPLLYFYTLIKEMPTKDITQYPPFWIVASILFYFSCTFVLSLILEYLINVLKDDLIGYWTYRNFMRFGFCIGITYGLLLDLRKTKEEGIYLNA